MGDVRYHVMVVRTQGRHTTTATLPEPLYPLTEQEPSDAWIRDLAERNLIGFEDISGELAKAVRVLRDGAA